MTSITRISGWSLEYILWELPYAAGLGMLHAEARYNDQDVVFVNGSEIQPPARGLRDDFHAMKGK